MPRAGDLTPSYCHQGRQAPPPRQAARVRRPLRLSATASRQDPSWCGALRAMRGAVPAAWPTSAQIDAVAEAPPRAAFDAEVQHDCAF